LIDEDFLMVAQTKKIGGDRVKLTQRDLDKLKRRLEELVSVYKGTFSDNDNGKLVKSTYTGESGKSFVYMWHKTPSDKRAQKNARSTLRGYLHGIGIRDWSRAVFKRVSPDIPTSGERQTEDQTTAWEEWRASFDIIDTIEAHMDHDPDRA